MTYYMDGHARELLSWLKDRYDERPLFGYPINGIGGIADSLNWTISQTRYTIDYVRKDLASDLGQITCFQNGKTWFYKIPTEREAEGYVRNRGVAIATQTSNVLFLVRKGLVQWRDQPYLVSAQTHLIATLEEMAEIVPEVDDLLTRAMRPIHENSFLG
jgi:hypothetical protein